MKRPLLPVLCAYCLGLCAARWQVLTLSQALTGFGLAFAGMVICFLLKRRLPATLAGIALFVFTGVLFLAPCRQPRLPSSHIVNLCGTGQVNLEGTIRESPAQRPGRTRFVVEARLVHTRDVTRPASGLVQVSIRTVNKKLRCGDRVRFFCRLKRPHNFNNPGSFDYVGYLADKRIFAKAFLPDDRGVVVTGVGDAPVLTLLVESFRDRVRDQIEASCSSPAREMIQALVLGEKGMLPVDIKADFSRLGISHLLAISGLHMGIVTWLAYALIMAGLKCYPRILLYLDGWKWAAVLAVIPAVLYGFVAGFQLPTVRALLMICAYVSALLLGRGHNLVNALMLAALVILLVLPASLFEASFQLSFAAVFCLVVVMPSLQQRVVSQRTSVAAQPGDMLERVRWCLLTSLIASAVVTIGTAPVVAACFHRISLVGVVVNMVMVPYVGLLVVPLCLVATAAVPLNAAVADLLFSGAGIFTELILNATAVWAGAAWAEITVMRPKLWEVGALYGLLLAVPVVLRRRKLKWYAAAVACFIILECGQAWWPRSPAGNLRVTFLDVGNGDAAVVEFPSGAVMLIDGGGFMDESFDIGRAVIAPFLYYNRLARVDYVVASHGHADHIGGLASVIDEFGIAEVWVNSAQVSTPLQRRLREVVRSRGGRVKVMGAGLTTLAVEGVRIMVFGADAADVSGTDHARENNKSLVMKIIWGETSFLFTGDVHIARENDLLLRNAPLGATVLKVPHHGRAGSSSKGFIRRVSPQVAVVSVRGNGSRNIPSAAVLQDYTALGVRVYRTDIQGAVSIESDGISFQVVPYLPTNY